MITTSLPIKKWGNSSAIILPKFVIDGMGLRDVNAIDFTINNKYRATFEVPAKKYDYTMEDMLRGMTKDNLHEPFDWGPDVGNEVVIY